MWPTDNNLLKNLLVYMTDPIFRLHLRQKLKSNQHNVQTCCQLSLLSKLSLLGDLLYLHLCNGLNVYNKGFILPTYIVSQSFPDFSLIHRHFPDPLWTFQLYEVVTLFSFPYCKIHKILSHFSHWVCQWQL